MRAGRIAAVLSFLLIVGCDDETGPNVSGLPSLGIQRVEVAPSSMTVLVPDTITEADFVQFNAVAFNRAGAPIGISDFAWRTSDETIALIDGTGLVVPLRPGTVEIQASAHKIGKATLVILPATERVEVTPPRDTILVDEPIVPTRDIIKLQARAFDPDGELRLGVAFTWTSDANNVVTVDEDGTVHATGLGSTSVLASSNNIFAGAQILVAPVVASVSVSSPVTEALVSDTIALTAVARDYANAVMNRTFNWTTSNPAVATVSATGVVNVVGVGQATITARTAHREASVNITTQERKLLTVEAGGDFTCGIAPLGRGYCWGNAVDGRTAAAQDSLCFVDTGTASSACILSPKQMNGALALSQVSAGGNFGCGLAEQKLYCWGNDEVGQIGNGNQGGGETPSLATVKSERFVLVSAGAEHACALNLVGTAYCWGSDSEGQLGDTRQMHSTTPIPVADTTLSFKAIAAGGAHTCAITQTGQAYCWGRGNEGQLGRGSVTDSDVPVPVAGGNTFVAIAAGGNHTCGVSTGGTILCWGDNSRGQLGIGGISPDILVPTTVAGAGGYTAVAAGDEHTCGLAGTTVRCWGASDLGQVGDGSVTNHNVASPVSVQNFQATSISAGDRHTCAMGVDGNAWCWGSNKWGALGNEFQAAIRATPQLVARPR